MWEWFKRLRQERVTIGKHNQDRAELAYMIAQLGNIVETNRRRFAEAIAQKDKELERLQREVDALTKKVVDILKGRG